MTHGQCDARPTVTFPVTGHRSSTTGTKLYCLVTEARVCEQLAQGRYLTAARPGVEFATSRVASQRLNHYTTLLGDPCLSALRVCERTKWRYINTLPFSYWALYKFCIVLYCSVLDKRREPCSQRPVCVRGCVCVHAFDVSWQHK